MPSLLLVKPPLPHEAEEAGLQPAGSAPTSGAPLDEQPPPPELSRSGTAEAEAAEDDVPPAASPRPLTPPKRPPRPLIPLTGNARADAVALELIR